jgi:hypothetical protein
LHVVAETFELARGQRATRVHELDGEVHTCNVRIARDLLRALMNCDRVSIGDDTWRWRATLLRSTTLSGPGARPTSACCVTRACLQNPLGRRSDAFTPGFPQKCST